MDKRIIASLIVEAVLFILYLVLYHPYSVYTKVTPNLNTGEGETCSYSSQSLIDMLNPINSINSGVEWGICQLGLVVNNYVAFTPNILSTNHTMPDGSVMNTNARDLLLKYIIPFSFSLLPIILIIYALRLVINPFLQDGIQITLPVFLFRFFLALLLILCLPVILGFLLDFINAVNQYIIENLLSSSNINNSNLTYQITSALNLDSLNEQSILSLVPSVIETILSFGLFIALLLLSFQFVIRFVLIWIGVIISPIVIILRIIPAVESYADNLIQKFFSIIIIQPIFLIGLTAFFQMTALQNNIITKFIIGIASLLALALIPGIVAGLSGRAIYYIGRDFTRGPINGLQEKMYFLFHQNSSNGNEYKDFGEIQDKGK